jgi:ABC-type transport system involved in cytochrome c biogenesis permease subunit
MDETAIQAEIKTPPADAITAALPPEKTPVPEPQITKKTRGPLHQVLQVLASLRLTVPLLAMGTFIIFVGTLAQMDVGLKAALDNYFRCWISWIPFELFVRFGHIFFNVSPNWDVDSKWGFYFPGGWLIGAVLLVNVLAAHSVRFKLSWSRAGILILHAGLIIMMLGELITGLVAEERRMSIWTGSSANYLEFTSPVASKMELAIVDKTNPKTDDVVVIPERYLRDGQTIENEDLPFDILVEKYYFNSTVPAPVQPGQENLASAGDGLKYAVKPRSATSGTDSGDKDYPSAYVTFKDKKTGKSLGTYLVSLYYTDDALLTQIVFGAPHLGDRPQRVTVDGKTYEVSLRYQRIYTPYAFDLKEFRHDVYEGTRKAKNYSSLVRLTDPSNNEDREVKIYMNNPLRYDEETFYQSGVLPLGKGTVLQVVHNPSSQLPVVYRAMPWLSLPLLSCILVSIGMIVHFGMKLSSFTQIKLPQSAAAVAAGAKKLTSPFGRFFPWLVVVGGLLYLLMALSPRQDPTAGFHLREFGRIPVMHEGRPKPIDSVARDVLMGISGKQEWIEARYELTDKAFANLRQAGVPLAISSKLEHLKDKQFKSRDEFLNEVNKGLLSASVLAQLERLKEEAKTRDELQNGMNRILEENGLPKPEFDHLQSQLLIHAWSAGDKRPALVWLLDVIACDVKDELNPALHHRVFRIDNQEVLDLLGLPARSGYRYALAEFRDRLTLLEEKSKEVAQVTANRRTVFQQKLNETAGHVRAFIDLIGFLQSEKIIPPAKTGGEWRTFPETAKQQVALNQEKGPATAWLTIIRSYHQDQPTMFNRSVSDYQQYVANVIPSERLTRTNFEFSLNAFEPYYQCMLLYIGVFLMASISWLGYWTVPLRRGALGLAIVAVLLHTFVLLARSYLMDRWWLVLPVFVTNLYSTAVFIGWVCLLMALVIEYIFKDGIALAVAGLLGFATAFISHYLARSGDTLGQLEAVLDTNFWLATHVTCINIGYAATALAGALGIAYLLRQVLDPNWAPEQRKDLSQKIYGVLCFGTLFSFVGTVLGGIWADQSWGRFWGWDPKENGAMMIVLMNALILHARWAGIVKAQGVAILTVVGNMVVGWSWFGTNQLGAGLHAYGFNPTLATGLRYFWLSQLAIIAVGLVPWHRWRRSSMPA